MDKTKEQMKMDSIISTASGKTARELELELQNMKMLLSQQEKELEQEREINRLLREMSVTQKAAMEKERKELNTLADRFKLESSQAMKSLNSAIRGYKDAMVAAASDDDYLQYCKTIQIDSEHTAYDYVVRFKKMYRQHENEKQDRLLVLETKARQQRSAAMAASNRIWGDENLRRTTMFDFDDVDDPEPDEPSMML